MKRLKTVDSFFKSSTRSGSSSGSNKNIKATNDNDKPVESVDDQTPNHMILLLHHKLNQNH